MTSQPCKHSHSHSGHSNDDINDLKEFALKLERIVALLDAHFGDVNHEEQNESHKLVIKIDEKEVKIDVEKMVSIIF